MKVITPPDRKVVHSHQGKPNKHGQCFGFEVLQSELGYWYGRMTLRRYEGGECVKDWASEPFILLAKVKVKAEACNEIRKDYAAWLKAIGVTS